MKFKNTNKQYGARGLISIFSLLFLVIFIYILFNFSDFWETHAFQTSLIMLIGSFVIGRWFYNMFNNGKESRDNAELGKTSLIIGGTIRIPLDQLTLRRYMIPGSGEAYLLKDHSGKFMLYSNDFKDDDLISVLLEGKVEITDHDAKDYKFKQHTDSTVTIPAADHTLKVNLDTGNYTVSSEEQQDDFSPETFIISPCYRFMSL